MQQVSEGSQALCLHRWTPTQSHTSDGPGRRRNGHLARLAMTMSSSTHSVVTVCLDYGMRQASSDR